MTEPVCPDASIARIGWQIDLHQPGNNMLFALDQWQVNEGHVSASRAWRPACSFMEAAAVATLCALLAFGLALASLRHLHTRARARRAGLLRSDFEHMDYRRGSRVYWPRVADPWARGGTG